jgi:magnesium-transporting ATPase (P-type)
VLDEWRSLNTGEILLVEQEQSLPVDLVVLGTSHQTGACRLQTSNLDGEQALKTRQALPVSQALFRPDAMPTHGPNRLEVGSPDDKLMSFEGYLEFDRVKIHLEPKQLLLRGSVLKLTDWVVGGIVYAGQDSKIMMNSGHPRFKHSHYERVMNQIIIIELATHLTLVAFLALASGAFATDNSDADYIFLHDDYIFIVVCLPQCSGFLPAAELLHPHLNHRDTGARQSFAELLH